MIEVAFLVLAGVQGIVLGAVFFGGLWWTVHRALLSKQPAILFFVSLVLRTMIVIAGFWLAAQGDWRRLVAGLLGFVSARVITLRLAGAHEKRERRHLTEGAA
jgi:F1F0 ATPase subunit 2